MKKFKQRFKGWVFKVFKTQIMKTLPNNTHVKIETQEFDIVVARARIHSDTYRKLQYDKLSCRLVADNIERRLKEMMYEEVMPHIVISKQSDNDPMGGFVEAKLYLAIKK